MLFGPSRERSFLRVRLKIKPIITISLMLVCLVVGSCASAPDFDAHLGSIVKPHCFSVASWEFETLSTEIRESIFKADGKIEDELGLVREYFTYVERIKILKPEIEAIKTGSRQGDLASLEAQLTDLERRKADLEDKVERIIARQITQTLTQLEIFNPLNEYIKLKAVFPPLNFKLEKPPNLLEISPRDRIESIREVLLKPDTNLEEKEDIEARVDKLGVSSLVVTLGGVATYPSFVTDDIGLRFTINAATEEWVHQYLTFTPLGFLYLLNLTGVSPNYEIAMMNETLASMVSKEIGAIVYDKYYSQYETGDNQNQAATPEFDFNREMREIRKAVDRYLEEGKVEQAEEFMEQKRQYLASKGYYLRKLNQAYFAFYGTYADSPTSVSPIGLELKELRNQSASLKAFLNTVAAMTSHEDLKAALSKGETAEPRD